MDLGKRIFPIAFKIRWMMIALAILSLCLIAKENIAKPEIYVPLIIIITYNIVAYFLHKKIQEFRTYYFETILDIFFVTSLIHSTGLIASPFYLFYFLILIFASCYYKAKNALIISIGICLIYLVLFVFQENKVEWIPHLLVRLPLFVAMACMSSVLVFETKLCEAELEDERQRAKMLQPQLQSTLYELNFEAKRLQELCNISLKLGEDIPFKKRLDYILDEICHFLKTDLNILFFLNPETGRLEVQTKLPIPIPSFKIGEGFLGEIVKNGKSVIINDIYIKDEPSYNLFKDLKLCSIICVPLDTQGLIFCGQYTKKRFGEREQVFLELVGKILILTMKNDKLNEEINRLSIADEETALFAYSYFKQKLKEELARSMRILRPLSLMVIKLEIPPQLMEIQKIGLIINSQTRADDMVTYNDGYFYILALRTGRDKIMVLAERIKREIETKTGYLPVIGISGYPSAITDHIELLRAANSALASAFKHRDRIVISE
ncbi:TPA: hypothetical protein DCX16_02565 [bacterium]|nr:hypothetical protein [bacterium]